MTATALPAGCQSLDAIAQFGRGCGGDYLLAVKDNQENLMADFEAEFAAGANGSPRHTAAA